MKAVLKEDRILHLAERDSNTEIGKIPKNVGLERLRFDGSKVVDLLYLSKIWVRPIPNNAFELHAVEVSGAQLVRMTYRQRKHLQLVNGVVQVKSKEQIQEERAQKKKKRIVRRQFINRRVLSSLPIQTPSEIEQRIDKEVQSLEDAKEMIKELAVVVRYCYLRINGE